MPCQLGWATQFHQLGTVGLLPCRVRAAGESLLYVKHKVSFLMHIDEKTTSSS